MIASFISILITYNCHSVLVPFVSHDYVHFIIVLIIVGIILRIFTFFGGVISLPYGKKTHMALIRCGNGRRSRGSRQIRCFSIRLGASAEGRGLGHVGVKNLGDNYGMFTPIPWHIAP